MLDAYPGGVVAVLAHQHDGQQDPVRFWQIEYHPQAAARRQGDSQPSRIAQGVGFERQVTDQRGPEWQTVLIGHQIASVEWVLGAQQAGDAAEVVITELADRVVRVLRRHFFQGCQLMVHVETLRMLMIEDIVRYRAQPIGNHLCIAADNGFGLALLYQFLDFFRQMQADGDVFLQIQRDLKGALQALLFEIAGMGQKIKLLIQQGDQIHDLLLAHQQRW